MGKCSFDWNANLRADFKYILGISIWLVPSRKERESLQAVISSLSKDIGSPDFPPHITLLSDRSPFIIPSEVSQLPIPTVPRFKVEFKVVQTGGTFYQSVLVAVHPSGELLELHRLTREALSVPASPETVYFPHLSLFYGDPSQEEKEAIAQALYDDGRAVQTNGQVTVGGVNHFEVSEAWVVRTEGLPADWKVLDKRQL
jgi:2',3'-cyclic-nucleotide 3'-phosphodiesterase